VAACVALWIAYWLAFPLWQGSLAGFAVAMVLAAGLAFVVGRPRVLWLAAVPFAYFVVGAEMDASERVYPDWESPVGEAAVSGGFVALYCLAAMGSGLVARFVAGRVAARRRRTTAG
jgi:hypothetical protein